MSYLISAFNSSKELFVLSHCILQSHFHGLSRRFTTAVFCNINRISESRVSKAQFSIDKCWSRGNKWPCDCRYKESCGLNVSCIKFVQPTNDNISRLVKFSKSFSESLVKFVILFILSSLSRGKNKPFSWKICVPDISSSSRVIGKRGILLIGFHDKSKIERLIKFLNSSAEKEELETFLKSRCFNKLSVQNAFSWIPSPIGLFARERNSKT